MVAGGFLCLKSCGYIYDYCCVCSRRGQVNIFKKYTMWSYVRSLPNGYYKKVRRFYLPSKRKYETCVSCIVLGNDRAVYLAYKAKKIPQLSGTEAIAIFVQTKGLKIQGMSSLIYVKKHFQDKLTRLHISL